MRVLYWHALRKREELELTQIELLHDARGPVRIPDLRRRVPAVDRAGS